jgi:hypothetical protein
MPPLYANYNNMNARYLTNTILYTKSVYILFTLRVRLCIVVGIGLSARLNS